MKRYHTLRAIEDYENYAILYQFVRSIHCSVISVCSLLWKWLIVSFLWMYTMHTVILPLLKVCFTPASHCIMVSCISLFLHAAFSSLPLFITTDDDSLPLHNFFFFWPVIVITSNAASPWLSGDAMDFVMQPHTLLDLSIMDIWILQNPTI